MDGDADFYATRERSTDERLPWDHFDVGVKKAGLLREWERTRAEDALAAGAAAASAAGAVAAAASGADR